MEYKDYYKVLGVRRDARAKDIKAAYRRLARKHHPDMNPGDARAEARFKEINEAHEVLSDPEKRSRYDQLGSNWGAYQSGRSRPWPGGGVHFDVGGAGDMGDLGGFSEFFRTFFSGGGFPDSGLEDRFGRGRSGRGQDLESTLDLTLEEVLRGATRALTVTTSGQRRTVEVKIPPGVREGSRIRVAGEGERERGGTAGDLFLLVRILPHHRLERREDDLQTTVSVSLTTAVLGGEARVPTLEGERGIKVPPGTPSGRVFRLRGLGLPALGGKGQRGDVLATVAVEIPRKLSDRERHLFEELRKLGR